MMTCKVVRTPFRVLTFKRKIMKYRCKENDVEIELHDDEVWIGIPEDNRCGKTVIGLKDLEEAINTFNTSKEDVIKTNWSIDECFRQLRTEGDGSGSITLTQDTQEEIVRLVNKFY